jgi:hypothetical protein
MPADHLNPDVDQDPLTAGLSKVAKAAIAHRRTAEEVKDAKRASLARAREAKKMMFQERDMIQKKVEMGLPITEEEAAKIPYNGLSKKRGADHRQRVLTEAAKLIIKPQNAAELRILVEEVVKRKRYNPIEDLIELGQDEETPLKERIGIHKSLLPYVVPQLPAMEKEKTQTGDTGVKVTIQQFVFPAGSNKKPEIPIHEQKPATVETTATPAP